VTRSRHPKLQTRLDLVGVVDEFWRRGVDDLAQLRDTEIQLLRHELRAAGRDVGRDALGRRQEPRGVACEGLEHGHRLRVRGLPEGSLGPQVPELDLRVVGLAGEGRQLLG
jgi:hypothetical protein